MDSPTVTDVPNIPPIVRAWGETPMFQAGDAVRVALRFPIGHYRVPFYLRGKVGRVERVIEPPELDGEEEGFGRNAGWKRHYYRIAVPLAHVWPNYGGAAEDSLRIEVYENWLEGI